MYLQGPCIWEFLACGQFFMYEIFVTYVRMLSTTSSKFGIEYSIYFASLRSKQSILNTRFRIWDIVLVYSLKSKNSAFRRNLRSRGSTYIQTSLARQKRISKPITSKHSPFQNVGNVHTYRYVIVEKFKIYALKGIFKMYYARQGKNNSRALKLWNSISKFCLGSIPLYGT